MLLVKTYIAPSKIHGLGLFAGEDIPKCAVVWKYKHGFDSMLMPNYVELLPKPAQEFLRIYAYQNKDTLMYVLCADNARFCNHSDTPNLNDSIATKDVNDTEGLDVANILIPKDTEITTNYRNFDINWDYGIKEVIWMKQ